MAPKARSNFGRLRNVKKLVEAKERHEREIEQLEEQENEAWRDKDLELKEIQGDRE